jgi:hypothetical protein
LKTRNGESDRRKQPRVEGEVLSDAEIKRLRGASAFDWATLLLPNVPVIIKALLLLGVGASGAVAVPQVYQSFTAEEQPPPIAQGETVVPVTITPELRQSLDSFDAAITRHEAELSSLREMLAEAVAATGKKSADADGIQDGRLDRLEELVQ